MSSKYVLVCASEGDWGMYWTDYLEHSGTQGISSQIHYTCNLSEATIYDTMKDALDDIRNTKIKGVLKNAEFTPIAIDEKTLFKARLKDE